METKRRKADIYPFITFLMAAGLRVICYLQPAYLQFRCDDFGTMIYPAYLAGYDWSPYVSGTNNYYGFGYYWIFAPLFRLIQDPKRLLMAMAFINSLLIAASSVLIYHLLVRYGSCKRGLITALIALVPSMFQGDLGYGRYWYRTDNEIPLYLICWLMVWLLLEARESLEASRRRRIALSAGMGLLIFWGLTVHERAMALLLTIVITEGFLYIARRRWLFQPLVLGGTIAAGFVLQRVMRRAVILTMWAGGWPKKNTSAFSRVSSWFLDSFVAIKTLLILFFGNMHNLLVKGYGLPAIAIFLVLWWAIKQLPLLRTKIFAKDPDVQEEWVGPGMLIMLTFGIAIMITIVGLAVRWGSFLYPGIAAGEVVYGYKGISHNRYYFTLIGPVIFGLFMYFGNHLPIKNRILPGSWVIFLGLEAVFFAKVFPYLLRADTREGTAYVKRSLGTWIFYGQSEKLGLAVTVICMLIPLILFSLAARPVKDGALPDTAGRMRCLGICAAFILTVFALDRGARIDTSDISLTFGKCEQVAAALAEMNEAGSLPEHVYLPYENWSFSVQFMNRDYSYEAREPADEQMEESNLVWRSKADERYQEAGYEEIVVAGYHAYTNQENTALALQAYADEPD